MCHRLACEAGTQWISFLFAPIVGIGVGVVVVYEVVTTKPIEKEECCHAHPEIGEGHETDAYSCAYASKGAPIGVVEFPECGCEFEHIHLNNHVANLRSWASSLSMAPKKMSGWRIIIVITSSMNPIIIYFAVIGLCLRQLFSF